VTHLLAERAALVTGGGGRLGMRIVAVLSREGAAVAAADLDVDAARAASAAVEDVGGRATGIEMDVVDERAVDDAITAAEATLGEIDLLVNCHGYVPSRRLLEMDADEWGRTFDVNVRGTMLTTRAFARRWVERGTAGAVVNLSSIAAESARRGASHYCSSKAAVSMLTQVCALELGEFGIRVNAVAPGLVLDDVCTEGSGLAPYEAAMVDAIPLGRTGAADEVAETVAFLLSERSRYTTGAVVSVTGGAHAGRTHMPYSGSA